MSNLVRDGFISKLKSGDKKADDSGVISPLEGAKKFAEMGANMFSGDEDRELVESLLGKSSSSSQRIKPRGSISQGRISHLRRSVLLKFLNSHYFSST